MRNKYKDQKSIEQQFAEAKLVNEKDKEHFIYEIAIEVLEKNPYIVEDTLALIDSTLLLNLSEEEVRARAEKNKKELDKLFGNNDKDEIDNLNDIKNYKSSVIPNKENKILDNDEETNDFEQKGVNIYYAKKQSRKSGKELSNDYPDWTNYEPPEDDEKEKKDIEHYLKRILDKKYGEGKWDKGPKSDYNKVKKAITRGGHKAWNAKK